jgi:hypothetical protein
VNRAACLAGLSPPVALLNDRRRAERFVPISSADRRLIQSGPHTRFAIIGGDGSDYLRRLEIRAPALWDADKARSGLINLIICTRPADAFSAV